MGAAASSSAVVRPTTALLSQTSDAFVNAAYRAAKLGFTEVVHYLVSRGLVGLDAVDGLGRTLLIVAVLNNKIELVEFLLENVELFDIDAAAQSGNTALHIAANAGSFELVSLLLDAGANPRAVNKQVNDATPLDYASLEGHESIVALLSSVTAPKLRPERAAAPADILTV